MTAHTLHRRLRRLEHDRQPQRTIVLSVAATHRDRADLVDTALADAGIVRTPGDLLVKTLRFCPAPGQPPARVVAVAPAPAHRHEDPPCARP